MGFDAPHEPLGLQLREEHRRRYEEVRAQRCNTPPAPEPDEWPEDPADIDEADELDSAVLRDALLWDDDAWPADRAEGPSRRSERRSASWEC